MKIGVVCDQLGNLARGGAEVQLDKTVRFLNRIEGVNVEIINYQTTNIEQYDIIHFFKSQYDYSALAEVLLSKNIPYVVSSIYFPPTNYKKSLNAFKISKLLPASFQKVIYFSKIYFLWNNASCVFPNTDEEASFIKSTGVKSLVEIIPNGLDPEEMKAIDSSPFLKAFPQLKDLKFVLNVARIDRRKNQKALVEACQKLNIPVVVIGKICDEDYFNEIQNLNYSKFFYLGPVYDRNLLFSAYNACELFCLPSTMETPGIAAMEAAYYNKPIVITKFGGTKYYFDDGAYYIDWRNANEIAEGIAAYYDKPLVKPTRPYIEKYTWDKIAERYVYLYREILRNSTRNVTVAKN